MAMPMPSEVQPVTSESRGAAEHTSEYPASGTHARRRPTAQSARMTPDEEAMLLMMKVVERVEVARSFAKIAAGLVTVTAIQASHRLRSAADREGTIGARFDRVRKIARAAADAAKHVATRRPEPESIETEPPEADDAPLTQDAPPG